MKPNTEKEKYLLKTNVFASLPEEKLQEIAQIVQSTVVPAHAIIFRQGDPGDSFYIINSGKVRVFRIGEGGIKTDLAELGPGESFGELALLTGEPRGGYVETLEETHLTVISKDQFDQILRDCPQVSAIFINQLSNWLIQSNLKLQFETEQKSKVPGVSFMDFLVLFGLSILFGIVFNLSNPHGVSLIPSFRSSLTIPAITTLSAQERYQGGKTLFVDARPSGFYKQGHIKGAINLPPALFDILYLMLLNQTEKEKEIIVYGRTLSSLYDEDIAHKLILRGHKNTIILQKGLSSWKEKGYPVEP
jgi:CRP-like cAMP-binding protein/rhodanese-related sulfurtransferase